ncbi:MAG TPA: DUF1214 domain-containing protein [Spongiibacteraceae bacterium]|jgi:hypothetical protein|nr:DUF1214 domain-containing protein [Spongiibacteraceae bacterium]HUH38759.1 DUF1214 domain-containing protein [Spongiibacteraceae bacterium]
MKKLLLVVLVGVLLSGAYLLGTFNASKTIAVPPAEWADDSEAARAWREFIASLEAAGARVFAATDDQRERLDGLVYLAQMAGVSLEMKLAKGSAENPRFTDWMSDYRKFLGDTPDAVYNTAELSPAFDYEITGNIGDTEYLGFALYGTSINGWNRGADNISNESMQIDESGNFTIVLSRNKPTEPDVDWLKMEDDVHLVMVRQYDHDREGKQQARFTIRNLKPPAFAPATDAEIAAGFTRAATFFNETVDGAVALADILSGGANSIDPPKRYSADFGGIFYPTKDNQYYGSWFYLEDDEALIVEGAVPDAPYWSVSLQNRWMQSLDYEHYQVSLNDKDIVTVNGRYRIVVSHRKPPSGNWLDTTGKREGLLSIRYQLPVSSEKPTLKVVRFDTL